MALGTILTNLATLGGGVSGVTKSYSVQKTPTSIHTASLPALIHLLGESTNNRGTFGGGLWEVTHRVTVRLLQAPTAQSRLEDELANIVTFRDNYLSALRNDDTLSGACKDAIVTKVSPAGVVIGPGNREFFGVDIDVEILEYL